MHCFFITYHARMHAVRPILQPAKNHVDGHRRVHALLRTATKPVTCFTNTTIKLAGRHTTSLFKDEQQRLPSCNARS